MSSKKPPSKFVLGEIEKQLFLDAVNSLPLHSKLKWIEEPIVKTVSKKNKEFEAKLDLHGLTAKEASLRLETFISRCFFLGYRRVLIVHGKGSGILKETVRSFLVEHSSVVMIIDAKPRYGGDGAVIAQIKRK